MRSWKYLVRLTGLFSIIIGCSSTVQAKIDLVTLPQRDQVQLTIYNSADLTLVREQRQLTLKEGFNALQFSWANTLIDPTSLDLQPRSRADELQIMHLTFPARTKDVGVWQLESGVAGKVPVEISYLTSGLSWRAFYLATLAADERTMRLEGYVRVSNESGEDYDEAQVRLVVGKINTIDEIADLARQPYPYGRPGLPIPYEQEGRAMRTKALMVAADAAYSRQEMVKEIIKEGLSEYFLYTIEGMETIPHGWSKRLPSFTADAIPVENLYKYDPSRFGDQVMRHLKFRNDERHHLGETPIPDGTVKVFRQVDDQHHLGYEGESAFKYIPVNEEVELSLGAAADVEVESVIVSFRTGNYRFDRNNDVLGWDEVREYRVGVRNGRDVPARVEVRQQMASTQWKVTNATSGVSHEKIDANTIEYRLELPSHESRMFEYTVTTLHGSRAE